MRWPREIQRSVVPVPDQPSFGLVTYDARDPDTKFPPIEPLRPPEGAPSSTNFLAIQFPQPHPAAP